MLQPSQVYRGYLSPAIGGSLGFVSECETTNQSTMNTNLGAASHIIQHATIQKEAAKILRTKPLPDNSGNLSADAALPEHAPIKFNKKRHK